MKSKPRLVHRRIVRGRSWFDWTLDRSSRTPYFARTPCGDRTLSLRLARRAP